MKITIAVRPLGQGKVTISTLDVSGQPIEACWTGPYYAALRERNTNPKFSGFLR